MKEHKLSTIVYAQGWLDAHITTHNDPFDITETDEYRQYVQNMWTIVNEGLDQLLRENTSLQHKLMLIDIARGTET
jgi:hypothetical protein